MLPSDLIDSADHLTADLPWNSALCTFRLFLSAIRHNPIVRNVVKTAVSNCGSTINRATRWVFMDIYAD